MKDDRHAARDNSEPRPLVAFGRNLWPDAVKGRVGIFTR